MTIDVRKGIVLTRGQIESWVGHPISDADVERLDQAVRQSTIPEAIGLIYGGFDPPGDGNTPRPEVDYGLYVVCTDGCDAHRAWLDVEFCDSIEMRDLIEDTIINGSGHRENDWRITDTHGFGDIQFTEEDHQGDVLSTVEDILRVLSGYRDDVGAALKRWHEIQSGDWNDATRTFAEAYEGHYDNRAAFAKEWLASENLDEANRIGWPDTPRIITQNMDYDGVAAGLATAYGYEFVETDDNGRCHVLHENHIGP